MIEYFGDDVKRVSHSLKVYGFAKAIAWGEKLDGQELLVLETAAVLHDIGIHEAEHLHSSSAGEFQELEGPPIARAIMSEVCNDRTVIDRVCYLVGHHHSYNKIDGADFQILVEADFLVNINEDNLSRDAALTIRQKYFKTASGFNMISRLYSLD
jgi:HD superfamily phosphodiesterase